jgi:FkbH-like protein
MTDRASADGQGARARDAHALARLRSVRRPGAAADPTLLDALARLEAPAARADAGRLLARVPAERIVPEGRRLRPMTVAMVGTFTADGVVPLLRLSLLQAGIAAQIQTFGFGQLVVQLSDPGSELARLQPDVTLCQLDDRFFLPRDWDPAAMADLEAALDARASLVASAVGAFAGRSPGVVLLHTVPLSPVEHRKVIGYRAKAQLGRLWRGLNTRLLELAAEPGPVHTLDLEAVLVDCPARVRDERLAQFAGMAWSPVVESSYAREAAGFCRAAAGLSKKVLVLDLDNTLWGGVLGDDGPAGIQLGGAYPGNCYADLQRAAAALRRQGVLLALCSKNDPALVDEVLESHPEIVLRAEDLVARAVNWGRKDHNIRQIAESLNLGLDSIVFVDDSRFECELVRSELPEVEVVHLDGDPADHLPALLEAGHFDVLAATGTDGRRTEMYRTRADRQRFAASFASAEDYLGRLDLRVTVTPADDFTLPRLVQLSLRTNQFNLAGHRDAEARTRRMAQAPDCLVLAFEVSDRFGREGIVGGVWIAKDAARWTIESLVMSCRVFSRGVEHAVLAHVVAAAAADCVPRLKAQFRPTDRNAAVRTFLEAAGFVRGGEAHGAIAYELAVDTTSSPVPDWILLEAKDALTHA